MLALETLRQIVDPLSTREQRQFAIRGFAETLEWRPSYEVSGFYGDDDVSDHLIVEHGLENAAAFSFVRSPKRAVDLAPSALRSLLAISYNNLIDWHLFVSESDVRIFNNRSYPDSEIVQQISAGSIEALLSGAGVERFKRAQQQRRSILACDDALIGTLSRWRRMLTADLGGDVTVDDISALFNAIILVRGCEDQVRQNHRRTDRLLISSLDDGPFDPEAFFQRVLDATGTQGDLRAFVDVDRLAKFRALDRLTTENLVRDFYRSDQIPYEYNFALISKHALSRVYEKYTALLEFDDSQDRQVSLFRSLPKEQNPSKSGSVYTPQYIASFFARYLEANVPPRIFRSMRALDPACGSGIFLRNLLELQANPLNGSTTPQSIAASFEGMEGVDRNPNACAAAKLSLALLHLVSTSRLPESLSITTGDSIERANAQMVDLSAYDAIVANPPYVKLDHLTPAERTLYTDYMGPSLKGRVDAYLAFVKLALEAAKPGGFVCLVLPQTFLTNGNAKPLRDHIRLEYEVRCLVDLSEIDVFEGVGAYTILLIVERRRGAVHWEGAAQIARIQDGVGPALQACLDRRTASTPFYQVFEVDQSYFSRDKWVVLSPQDASIEIKLSKLAPISHYMDVNQGFATGSDKVFIRPKKDVPKEERAIWAEYLQDREMERYSVPRNVEKVVFFPFADGRPLDEQELQDKFPKTWAYLLANRETLSSRRVSVWWQPTRSRKPDALLRPKVVCPHLVLTPKFGIDRTGRYAVSHGPFVAPKRDQVEEGRLAYFAAILNSSVFQWYMRSFAPKYGRGYTRLEVGFLSAFPVPDPERIAPGEWNRLMELVERATNGADSSVDREISALVESFYQLDDSEVALLWGRMATHD